ncbi:MAG TPA: iron ABC transporter permease [Bacteroidales bacterium]|nr:iron ABC transporter permease [Bacteroidales bacterium]
MVYKDFIQTRTRKKNVIFSLLVIALISLFFLDIFLGSVNISPWDVFNALVGRFSENRIIIIDFRLPKAITALLVGSALSISGLQMQTVFRNPMAGPYVLGISSGASLGVALVMLGSTYILPDIIPSNWMLVLSAWIGAGAVLLVIMMISVRIKDIMIILILGIMMSSGISAIVTILQYFSSETMLKAYVLWTMGSLGNLTSSQLNVLFLSVASGLVISLFTIKMMNALLLGENYANSLGLKVNVARIIIFLCTSILAGSVTAFCGPIGFVGIAVPHLVRIMFRTSEHRILVPGTIITGSCVMIACDIISQLPGSDRVLPVNAVTSFIGIPVVIWVILKNRKYSGI